MGTVRLRNEEKDNKGGHCCGVDDSQSGRGIRREVLKGESSCLKSPAMAAFGREPEIESYK